MDNNNLIYKYLKVNDTQDSTKDNLPGETGSLSSGETAKIDIDSIKEKIKEELVFYGNIIGQTNYRLAKVLYENTKDLDYINTHRVYSFVVDYLGISLKTIKQLVWIYKKLEKYRLWHNHTGLFKFRLFQLVYYISKHTNEPDLLIDKVYRDIVNNHNLKIWFENANWTEILNWFKEVYKTYLRVFRPKATGFYICDICNTQLNFEDYKKNWDNIPICFNCYDYIKTENKEKLAILKHTIAKKLSETNIEELKRELEETKTQLVKTIEELDKLRLAKSKRYKKIIAKIET